MEFKKKKNDVVTEVSAPRSIRSETVNHHTQQLEAVLDYLDNVEHWDFDALSN